MTTTVSVVSLVLALASGGAATLAIVRERRLAAELARERLVLRRLTEKAPTALNDAIRLLRVGQRKSEVLSLLGEADEVVDGEWFYRLDDHSGYLVDLDPNDRVRAVRSWKS